MHLFYSRLRYYFGPQAIKRFFFGETWARIEFKSAPCTRGHLPFHLNFSIDCCPGDEGQSQPILNVSIWEKSPSKHYFEMISETRQLRLRSTECVDGALVDDTLDAFFMSTYCRSPQKFIPVGSLTCEPVLPDRFEAFVFDNILSYFSQVLCDGDSEAEAFVSRIRTKALECLAQCETDDPDEPEEPSEGEDFELRCPETYYTPPRCVVYALSVVNIGNGFYRGYGFLFPPRIVSHRRSRDGENGQMYCEPVFIDIGQTELRPAATFYVGDVETTGDVITDQINRLNRFQELYAQRCGPMEGEEPEDDPTDNPPQDDPNRACGLYIILELAMGVRFEYEVPGQEDVVLSNLQLLRYAFEVDIPLSLTNEQFLLVNLVSPDFSVQVDLDGISIDVAFQLELGNFQITSQRFSRSLELQWSILFPQLTPILAALAAQPITPYASISFIGLGRRNC